MATRSGQPGLASAPLNPVIRALVPLAAACVVWLMAIFVANAAAALETRAKQAILVDMSTGQVLFDKAADQPMAPSSMAKLMTIYLLFDGLKSGRIKLDDEFAVSKKAWRMRGSKMFVKVKTKVRVEDLIRGIIVHSGNDASVVIAEGLAGTEEEFAARMNKMADEIGLTNSNFTNSTGWPDADQYMTAADIATLSRRLIEDFPEYYHYFAETSFRYGKMKPQNNRNPLLYRPQLGADGLKTGQTRAGGFGLAASAERDGRRLILVVNGLESVRVRSSESARLLSWGFRAFANYPLFGAGDTVETAEVWLGERASVPLATVSNVTVSLPRAGRSSMKVTTVYQGPLPAPVRKGDPVAVLRVSAPGAPAREFPLVAASDVARAGFLGRATANLKRLVEDMFQ
ncbi:MAG: D-alanyl-D-alanine carboxypeptidase family protein [Alphaproteobacteria bacterium]|nr:D-alanyl-D-alanine carboxypeptidase family protein [Alphaproteobacteria bacterium]